MFIVAVICVFVVLSSGKHNNNNQIGNGCSVADMVFFSNLIAHEKDIATINENNGEVSDEMIDFFETQLTKSVF